MLWDMICEISPEAEELERRYADDMTKKEFLSNIVGIDYEDKYLSTELRHIADRFDVDESHFFDDCIVESIKLFATSGIPFHLIYIQDPRY